MIRSISSPPKWIFLENVKRFHLSEMHGSLLEVLKERDYTWKQFVVSPIQIGVPNNRKRFYLLCERSKRFHGLEDSVMYDFPQAISSSADKLDAVSQVATIQKYISEPLIEEGLDTNDLYLSDELLAKPWARGLSVVSCMDQVTFCFTGSYGKVFHKSSGSAYRRLFISLFRLLILAECIDVWRTARCHGDDACGREAGSLLFAGGTQALAAAPLDRSDMTAYAGSIRSGPALSPCFNPSVAAGNCTVL
jgi:hypothetical protein